MIGSASGVPEQLEQIRWIAERRDWARWVRERRVWDVRDGSEVQSAQISMELASVMSYWEIEGRCMGGDRWDCRDGSGLQGWKSRKEEGVKRAE
jgi:hypothetical protein